MPDKLKLLEEKVVLVLSKLDGLKEDNATLRKENVDLRSQVSELQKGFENLRLNHNDQSDLLRSKLASVLERIEHLEKIEF